MIDVVVLAAGASSRFGADKLLTDVDGRALLELTLDVVLDATDVDRVVAVTGPGDEARRVAAAGRGVRTTIARDCSRGVRWSIHAGLAATGAEATGVAVVLGDDPLAATALPEVLARATRAPDQVVAVRRTQVAPHPVHLPRAAWPVPPTQDDDAGLRALLGRHHVQWIDVPDAPSLDVDVPADVIRLRRAVAGSRSRPPRPAAR